MPHVTCLEALFRHQKKTSPENAYCVDLRKLGSKKNKFQKNYLSIPIKNIYLKVFY